MQPAASPELNLPRTKWSDVILRIPAVRGLEASVRFILFFVRVSGFRITVLIRPHYLDGVLLSGWEVDSAEKGFCKYFAASV